MPSHKTKPQSENVELGVQAQTFTLRIWLTDQKGDAFEWRGRIQHVQSGEVQYCQNWNAFIAYIEKTLRKSFDF